MSEERSAGDPAAITGSNPAWGVDPHDQTKRPAAVPFRPAYVTVICISSNGAWNLTSNHASFGIDDPANNTAERRLEQALRVLRKIVPNGHGNRKKLRELAPGKPNAEARIHRRADGSFDRDDFVDLGFNSQHEIFVYYDSPAVQLDDHLLISFSRQRANGSPAAANDSFFVSRVPDQALGGPLHGRMIRIENFNTMLANGTSTPRPANQAAATAVYSLNLHFILPGAQPLPLVIDPDTGNGMGNEP